MRWSLPSNTDLKDHGREVPAVDLELRSSTGHIALGGGRLINDSLLV